MHHFCRNILINMLGKYLYRYFDIWQRYISINTFGKISSKLFFVVAKHRRTIVNKITNYWSLKAMEDIIYFLLARLENGVGNLRSQNLCKIYTGHFQIQPGPIHTPTWNNNSAKIPLAEKLIFLKHFCRLLAKETYLGQKSAICNISVQIFACWQRKIFVAINYFAGRQKIFCCLI